MEQLLLWGLGLILIGALLLVAELFIPSGGILGVTAALVSLAGVGVLFKHDTTWGLSSLLGVLILGPTLAINMFRWYTSTPLGRKVMGLPSEAQVEADRAAEMEKQAALDALIGLEGVAKTDLRPIGVVDIDGKRYDAVSDTVYVQRGARVKVIVAEPHQVRVRMV